MSAAVLHTAVAVFVMERHNTNSRHCLHNASNPPVGTRIFKAAPRACLILPQDQLHAQQLNAIGPVRLQALHSCHRVPLCIPVVGVVVLVPVGECNRLAVIGGDVRGFRAEGLGVGDSNFHCV